MHFKKYKINIIFFIFSLVLLLSFVLFEIFLKTHIYGSLLLALFLILLFIFFNLIITKSIKTITHDLEESKELNDQLQLLNCSTNEVKKVASIQKYVEIINNNIITSSTDLKGKITSVSEAFCKISGYTKEELIGKNHNIVRHPDVDAKIFKKMWSSITHDIVWSGEIKNLKKGGGFYWVSATIYPLYDELGEKVGYTAVRQDITSKKLLEEIAITDALTGIFNRRHFNDIFPKILSSAKRKNELVAFLIMDIDLFKQYNDTYGHQMGDEALKRVAFAIKSTLNRNDDFCFRLGGEEFGVIFKALKEADALLFAHKIKDAIDALKIVHEKNSASAYISVSIGLVCKNARDIENDDTIYKQADDLLYKAKDSGKNQIVSNLLS